MNHELPDDIEKRINMPYPEGDYWLDWLELIALAGEYNSGELLSKIREDGENTTFRKDLS